ncbi:transporter [Ganoderma sinense ZZ0214-1]|uniref:Transporter n=1 Tax=Ganoderma sinense ZZ0214-1 TaxID=1077348 RepID=A0A2G8RUI4_9APHY|nr:transporter [Ganoderma sinense ZZ0214-1]
MAARRNLYDILGIPQNATADDIRKAYKLKALETHPDKLAPGSEEEEIAAAESKFRDVRTAFDVLSDPAKRKAYDNGLNFIRRRVNPDDVQAKLARERAEWQRQAELRHQERMRVLHQEILASQKRYQDTKAQAELRYQEKMKAMEEQLQVNHKAEVAAAEEKPEEAYTLADEMLSDLRRRAPEWEIRKQKVLRQRAERMNSTASATSVA